MLQVIIVEAGLVHDRYLHATLPPSNPGPQLFNFLPSSGNGVLCLPIKLPSLMPLIRWESGHSKDEAFI